MADWSYAGAVLTAANVPKVLASAMPYLAARRVVAGCSRGAFGNPFRPVAPDSSWLTSTVVALAAGIDAESAFDRLPILAEALQDAGCEHAAVLDHCRGNVPYVRGCWVVALVLGGSSRHRPAHRPGWGTRSESPAAARTSSRIASTAPVL
jgi:hypothetical protein